MDQPINVIAHHINVSGQRQDLRPALGPPGLDSANFVAVQQNSVVSTPTAEGSNPSTGCYSKICLDSLLKRHSAMAPFAYCPQNGELGAKDYTRSYTKKTEKCQEEFSGRFSVDCARNDR